MRNRNLGHPNQLTRAAKSNRIPMDMSEEIDGSPLPYGGDATVQLSASWQMPSRLNFSNTRHSADPIKFVLAYHLY